jgi:hypothetical protein
MILFTSSTKLIHGKSHERLPASNLRIKIPPSAVALISFDEL